LAAITQANASTYLTQVVSEGGLLGVDAPSLLQPGTRDYPTEVNEVSTGAPVSPWRTTYTAAALAANNISRVPTGGETYAIAVTADLYNVLQAAQVADGSLTLPSGHSIGSYVSDGDLPSLSSNFIAALLAGNVQTWANVEVNDAGVATPLTSFASAAGVTAPGNNAIGVSIRNDGAAVGALGYATFLGYPYVAGSSAPANDVPDNATAEFNAAPLVKGPTGTTDTDNLLNDWQYGDNVSGHNNVLATTSGDTGSTYERIWGVALQTGDRNYNASLGYRYIKVDGAAATLANIANGSYRFWGEGEVLVNPNAPSYTASVGTFLTDFGNALGSVTTAYNVDNATGSSTLAQPYGLAGIFATSKTAPSAAVPIPFPNSLPLASGAQLVVPYTHNKGGYTSIGVVPYAYDPSGAFNPTIQLK
ncbi:MAG: hypothetical protein ABSB19_09025, partial [Methylomonas sp.]